MKQKRLIGLFGAFLLAFGIVMGRLYLLASNQNYAQSAQAQTVTTLRLAKNRGNIYDHEGAKLTGGAPRYFALSIPGEASYAQLFQYVPYSGQELLYQKRNSLEPFLVEVDRDLSDQGIYTYSVPSRYPDLALAEHLVGYVDGEGDGVSGLEGAFDEVLGQESAVNKIECVTTARGGLLRGSEPELLNEGRNKGGLVLTLDKSAQRACEGIACKDLDRGCILVLETATARVLASVSMPRFDPQAIQKSIEAQDTSLLNRPFCAFNVGSVFKPVLAAAALEKDWDWYSTECVGAVDVDGQVYRCAEGRAHGEMNLKSALCKSCNCFFIELGQKLGGQEVETAAEKFGFGEPVYLAGGMKSAAGTLPKAEDLKSSGELANLSFGQGKLSATPIQVAAAMNVIASDGKYRTPAFLDRVVNEATGKTIRNLYEPGEKSTIAPETAKRLREMLIAVVEEGLGKDAKPEMGGAGGKTGTAQTGSFTEEGEEKMNYWFAGFYPAQQPKYTIVVMQDGTVEPRVSSGRIFAKVCDALSLLGDL